MNETARILCAIKPEESVTFRTLWKRLPGMDLARVMDTVDTLENQGLVVIDKSHHLTEVRLTSFGAEFVFAAGLTDNDLPERKPNHKAGLIIDA